MGVRATKPKVVAKAVAKPKRSKFGSIKTVIDGITFASRAEARYYEILRDRQLAGEIDNLKLQRRYPIVVNGEKVCVYVADFDHDEVATGEHVTTDVKGKVTDVYRLKKRLMLVVNNVTITEIPAGAVTGKNAA